MSNKPGKRKPAIISVIKLPVECVLYGVPATLQSASERIRRWQEDVATTLRERRGDGTSCLPHGSPVRVRVRYYYPGSRPDRDVDNILKPILDAAKGIIYQDDKQVVEVCSHRFSRANDQMVIGNQLILDALRKWDSDFVHLAFRDGNRR